MNQETKVGLFILASIAAILTSILFLGKVRLFQKSHTYYVDFSNVEALPPKAAVKIAGVEIGKVGKVRLVEGHARISIEIDHDIELHKNTTARVGSTGIIGTRFIEIDPGTDDQPILQEGDILHGANGGSLEKVFNQLGGLFEEDSVYGNPVTNLKATIANIRHVSEALDKALGQKSSELQEIVMNVRDLTESAKVFTQHLEEITTEKKEDVKLAITKFKEVGEKLDEILARINKGEGTLGALVKDEKTATNVKEAISSIKDTADSAKKVMGRFTKVNTYWDYRLRYNVRDGKAMSDLGVTFSPRNGKYYSLGIVNAGTIDDAKPNDKYTGYARKNRATITIGGDLGPFTGYAGAIRSRGGVGLNYRPLYKVPKWERRLEFNAETYDYGRDEYIKGQHFTGANLDMGAHLAVTRWWWLGARVEDILQRAAFMAYTNIVIRDEDFAYLMGWASFAR